MDAETGRWTAELKPRAASLATFDVHLALTDSTGVVANETLTGVLFGRLLLCGGHAK